MYKYLFTFLLVWSADLVKANEAAPLKMNILIVDESDQVVEGARVGLAGVIGSKPNPGGGFPESIYDEDEALTDADGMASLKVQSLSSQYGLSVNKDNYYGGGLRQPQIKLQDGKWITDKEVYKFVIKRKKRPIRMYVKEVEAFFEKENAGYDLMIGDWVAPLGKGKVADFKFSIIKQEMGQDGSVDLQVNLTFSNEHDGFIVWKADHGINTGSILKSLHEAPSEGYQSMRELYLHRKSKKFNERSDDKSTNYYFRVRTKVDEHGNVTSAHYGKIYQGIEVTSSLRWPKPIMGFVYYLNPNSNDRGMEYAPTKNLLKSGRSFAP